MTTSAAYRVTFLIALSKPVFALGLAFFLAVLPTGCGWSQEAEGKKKEGTEVKPIPVEVAAVEEGPIEMILKASSTLEVEKTTPVLARTGNLVKEILAKEGDRVEKDQVLFLLEDDVQKTMYQKELIQFEKSEQEYKRDQSLFSQNLISEQVFKDREFEFRQRKVALEEAKRELDYTRVIAPIAGTVVEMDVRVGYPVNLGSFEARDSLVRIMDFDSMQAVIHVPEKHLPKLEPDLRARVFPSSLPGKKFEAYILRVAPMVSAATGTVEVTLAFEKIGSLRPGMYVDVELVLQTKGQALLVPKRALVYDNDQTFLFRLKDRSGPDQPRKVERLAVEPAMSDRFHIEPQPGLLQKGDLIVINGQTGLKDDAVVRLPEDPVPEPPPGT